MPWCPSDVSNSILTCFHSSFRTSDSHSSLVACCLFRSFMFRDTIILSNSQFKEGREDLEELGREREREAGVEVVGFLQLLESCRVVYACVSTFFNGFLNE